MSTLERFLYIGQEVPKNAQNHNMLFFEATFSMIAKMSLKSNLLYWRKTKIMC